MSEALFYLVVGVIIGALGAIVGVGVIWWLQSSGQAADAPEQAGQRPPAMHWPSTPAAAPRLSDYGRRVTPAGMDDVLHVWRSETDRALVLELHGRHYRQPADVSDEAIARELSDVLRELAAFERAAADTPAQVSRISPPSAPPPSRSEAAFLRTLGAHTPPGELVALGIAGQIEALLQQRLDSRPDLVVRMLHVGSAPDGSLQVMLDGNVYGGVDEVPDPAAREMVRLAIKDWEVL